MSIFRYYNGLQRDMDRLFNQAFQGRDWDSDVDVYHLPVHSQQQQQRLKGDEAKTDSSDSQAGSQLQNQQQQQLARRDRDDSLTPFGRGWGSLTNFGLNMPSMDVVETENEFRLQADIPGMRQEDVKLSIDNNMLTLSGERKMEKRDDRDNYHRVERSFGSFRRQLMLPKNVDLNNISANHDNGVLTVTMPKIPAPAPKSIKVNFNGPKGQQGGNQPENGNKPGVHAEHNKPQ